MGELLKVAFAEFGEREISGDEHNARIVAYAQETGFEDVRDDETPWCSIFVNYCCDQLGLERSGKANARSWLQIGMDVKDPQPGDIVVFWRENVHSWKGHVGIFLGFSRKETTIFCLGGNQGDQVSIAAYDAGKVLGFRRLGGKALLEVPQPSLRRDDRGEEVIKLQNLLNGQGYEVGDADGIFGDLTVAGLKLLQANHRIPVDGIYGPEAQSVLTSLVQT